MNFIIFDSFVKQARINIKDDENFKKANEILAKNKPKEYKPKSEKKYLVAVQREASKSKFLKLCSDSKISTIDNIDSEIGKISLSMLIKDESIVGNYGVGENVTDLMPFSK